MSDTTRTTIPLTGEARDARFAAVQKRTMAVLVITQIVGTLGLGVAPTIAVLIAGDVTNNEAWAGLARTASTLGAALLGLPLGNLAARYGRRVALSSGWWIAALGTGILVVAAEKSLIVPLFVGLLLLGAGAATSLQSRFTATDLAKPKQKARSLALIVWVGTIGSVIGPNIGIPGKYVGEFLGISVYAASFMLATIFLLIAGTIIFVMLRPDPLLVLMEHTPATRPAPTTRKKGSIRNAIALLRTNKPARIAVIAILVGQVVMASIMTMTPVHIMHQETGTVNQVGITISLHVLGMFAFSPVSGWVVDRFGHRVSMWIGISIFMVSLLFAALAPNNMTFILASLFLLGLGWSFVNIAGSALFAAVVPDEGRASSQGGVDALSNLFGATASFLAGPLLAFTNFSVLSVLAMFALIPLAVAILRRIPAPPETAAEAVEA